jgi:YD repeat-containing protein
MCRVQPDAVHGGGMSALLASPPYNGDNQDRRSTFDGEGNPTTYVNPLASATFSFDPEDRLTNISAPAFSARYDGDGLRGSKTAAGVTTYYLYDAGDQPVLEETFNASTS